MKVNTILLMTLRPATQVILTIYTCWGQVSVKVTPQEHSLPKEGKHLPEVEELRG
jgi:hypothetical protein